MFLNSYLFFNGQCEAAFTFYAQCFHGQIEVMLSHVGTPMEQHVPPEWRDKIMHARLKAGDSIIMGSDSPPDRYETPRGVSTHIGLQDPAEAERIFSALAEGGTVEMPIQKTFWSERFGMLVDRFGIAWMINCASANFPGQTGAE